MATAAVEAWDDDDDLDLGGFSGGFNVSTGTAQTSISSRMSVHSESIAGGDEDWNLIVSDEQSTQQAIQSAQRAGVPLPTNVPTSALLGGTIKRLGKKKSRQKVSDDWANDIDMPDSSTPLELKPAGLMPHTPRGEEQDDFDELEGSLGIRFAGTKRDARNRSSSVSAMSPSLASVTVESEEDELRGLELPEGPMDFEAILKKRRAADAELSDIGSQQSPALEQQATMHGHKKSKLETTKTDKLSDDFANDFELDAGEVLDFNRKRTINKNIKVKSTRAPAAAAATHRPATTINFHDKPIDKPMHTRSHIPRPVSGTKPASTRLDPVFESGASQVPRDRRQPATTTSQQLLRSKRSMPVLTSQQRTAASTHKPPVPSVPSSAYSNQLPYAQAQRHVPYHLRRESDPHRGGAQSPPPRPHSRLSNALVPDTPSRGGRQRADVAPRELAREAAAKRNMAKPMRRRNYGDGNELDVFDDLPTSTTKESKFIKQPVAARAPRPGLRTTQSRNDLREPLKRHVAVSERMMTPAPPRTPASPTKGFYNHPNDSQTTQATYTPSYLRDTAASRIARESRLGGNNNNPRPRSEGPLMPLTTNWKAQVAARSPHTSPSAQRQKPGPRKLPQLIKGVGCHVPKTEKGMVYNPNTLRWEGNENTLAHFDALAPLETPTATATEPKSYMDRAPAQHGSPPRPALIAPMSNAATQGVQVNGGMVFDPRQMRWLKLKTSRDVSGPLSPSVTDGEDEDDPFAGIEDLKDANLTGSLHPAGAPGFASPVSVGVGGAAGGAALGEVHEEFDLGPKFIDTQRLAEETWWQRCGPWFPRHGDGHEPRSDDGRWRWALRDLARAEDSLFAS